MFPGAQRMNRGNHEIAALVRACKANSVTDLVILHETRGQPGEPVLCLCHKSSAGICCFGLQGVFYNATVSTEPDRCK